MLAPRETAGLKVVILLPSQAAAQWTWLPSHWSRAPLSQMSSFLPLHPWTLCSVCHLADRGPLHVIAWMIDFCMCLCFVFRGQVIQSPEDSGPSEHWLWAAVLTRQCWCQDPHPWLKAGRSCWTSSPWSSFSKQTFFGSVCWFRNDLSIKLDDIIIVIPLNSYIVPNEMLNPCIM